jgi:hypothetical protein
MRYLRSIAISWAAMVAVSGCTSVVNLAWEDAGGASSDEQQARGTGADASSAGQNQGGASALRSDISEGTETPSAAGTTATTGGGGMAGTSSSSELGTAGAGSAESKVEIPRLIGDGPY